MHVEVAGGAVLLAAALVALIWANSPWQEAYRTLFHTEISLQVGSWSISEDLTHWINDGLMAIFFYVVGVEIKREWVSGELQDRRAAALPAFAALGGMVVPAAIFLAITAGTDASHGWGIPMATDIAFALSVLALMGRRLPSALRVFLLTLAIVDDIGAIVVIAIFYNDGIAPWWLLGAAGAFALAAVARRAHILYHPLYLTIGLALWLCLFQSGVHATLAGVIMGLLTPGEPFLPDADSEPVVEVVEAHPGLTADELREARYYLDEAVPLTERMEYLLHPWSSYVIVPLFALANAGVSIRSDSLSNGGRVFVAVAAGLVLGKAIGISLFSWVALRAGFGRLPAGVHFSQLVGIACLAGIGFTVSLFVSSLAFEDAPAHLDAAKLAILIASVVAAILGSIVLLATSRHHEHTPTEP
jgi:Na+:H+ antiporter, NhaA family